MGEFERLARKGSAHSSFSDNDFSVFTFAYTIIAAFARQASYQVVHHVEETKNETDCVKETKGETDESNVASRPTSSDFGNTLGYSQSHSPAIPHDDTTLSLKFHL